MSRLCFPYGAGIECTCDGRTKRILRCISILASSGQGKEPPSIADSYYEDPDVLPVESESERGDGGDERTELLLAATFLLMVILSFLGFLIHRCERHLLRHHHYHHHSPSLASVAIQTAPVMMTNNGHHQLNGEILTVSRIVNGGGHVGVVGHQGDHELGHFASSPPSQQFDPQYGEICTISRTVGTHLSTSPSDQGLAQDTVTHHSEVSTPQDTQQFYRIVPQDHPQQHCHPTQDQSSKDFHQFHNATRKDYQHFDTVQESQELRHFQQSQDQNGQSQDYQGVETVHHPAQRTQESGDLRQEVARGVGGDLHQEVAREVGGDLHQEVGRGVGQDPQQFRMQLEEMIAARQENEQRTDFRKEVDHRVELASEQTAGAT